jgi:uncharacterized membrane protein
VINDRQAKTGGVDFLIIGPHTGLFEDAVAGALPQVYSPSDRGLVLFRTLIDDEAHVTAIDAARRRAGCGAYKSRAP